jgi:aquaglyceroporin related protein
MLAVLFTGDVSGGHLNPAITIALAAFGKFPWRKVPLYLLAQIVGAFLGGVIAQANYYELANAYEGGYGIRTLGSPTSSFGVFVTTPADWMSNIGSSILLPPALSHPRAAAVHTPAP